MVLEDTNADILPGHKILCSSSSFLEGLKCFGLKSGQKCKGQTEEVQKEVV